jgi:hypothetical protein
VKNVPNGAKPIKRLKAKDFAEAERTITTFLETIERYEEVCAKKVLTTQKKLAGCKGLFWTLPEESTRKVARNFTPVSRQL